MEYSKRLKLTWKQPSLEPRSNQTDETRVTWVR